MGWEDWWIRPPVSSGPQPFSCVVLGWLPIFSKSRFLSLKIGHNRSFLYYKACGYIAGLRKFTGEIIATCYPSGRHAELLDGFSCGSGEGSAGLQHSAPTGPDRALPPPASGPAVPPLQNCAHHEASVCKPSSTVPGTELAPSKTQLLYFIQGWSLCWHIRDCLASQLL